MPLLTTAARHNNMGPAAAAGQLGPPCLPEYTARAHLSEYSAARAALGQLLKSEQLSAEYRGDLGQPCLRM
jgi:hypothetical protein